MSPIKVLIVGAAAVTVGAATLLACDDDTRATFAEEPDAADVPEASLPPVDDDAGESPTDAAAPRPKPEYDASDEPVVCTNTPCVIQLVAGAYHFCALLSDRTVRCWGNDGAGELGRGERDAADNTGTPPLPVVGITTATQISATPLDGHTTCARTAEGRVKCWGENVAGQLGLQASPALSDYEAHPTPSDVDLTAEIVRVDVGPRSVCALDEGRNAYCWGYNRDCQLARPDDSTSYSDDYQGPGLSALGDYEVLRIAFGYDSVIALTNDRQVVGWGKVSGRPSSLRNTPVPGPIEVSGDVTAVGSGGLWPMQMTHCVIANGSLYCWGNNRYGAIGLGGRSPLRFGVEAIEPRPVVAELSTDGGVYPQQLALSQYNSCVRMTDGTLQCSGGNEHGELGRGSAGTRAVFFERATAFSEYAVQVAMSAGATCALIQGGKVMCWGSNRLGELGQGTMDGEPHPTPVTVIFP